MKKQSLIQLKNKIVTAAQDYYEGKPKITDEQFDELVDELKQNNPNDDLLKKVGWGMDIDKINGNKFEHKYGVVGSLNKVHNISELPTNMLCDLIASSKLDGASCVAYYTNGKFIHAVTRGNGSVGIIRDLQFNKIIEKYKLNLKNFTGAVRGEIVISNSSWLRYKEKYPDAKFPRNVATGLFMRDDVSEDLSFVEFVTYKIMGCENQTFTDYEQILDYLSDLGFETVNSCKIEYKDLTDETMTKVFNSWNKYPMDGIVLQSNINQKDNYSIEYTDIAYKFQAEVKETTVTKVEWNLSKNNIMIPLVYVQPVELSGAIVSKTSGFNYKYIVENNVGKGTKIKLCRSGEVVPYIKQIVSSTEAQIPFVCPVCGCPLENDDTELYCPNEECANIEKSRLLMWLQVIGVRNLLGVGDALLENLYVCFQKYFNRKNIVIEDLYYEYDSECIIKQFTPAAAEKVRIILDNLQNPVDMSDVIYACNIRGLGKTICDKIAPIMYEWYINKNDEILNEISTISGLGQTVQNIVKNARNVFARLFCLTTVKNAKFPQNLTPAAEIMITGALSISRKQFEDKCKEKNIYVTTSIKNCKYLVTNETNSESSKMKKAKANGITIISEKDFCKLFNIL